MSATAWLIIAIVGFSLAGIAFIAAIILFIKMNIPAIIGDLTGKTVAREIKAMRESNASSGDKRFRPSAVNMERGILTDKVSPDADAIKIAHASKRVDKTDDVKKNDKNKRSKGGTVGLFEKQSNINSVQESSPTDILSSNATEVLSNPTEVLEEGMTDVLTPATEVSNQKTTDETKYRTTVLNNTEELDLKENNTVSFKITRNEIRIHSDEVI